MEQDKDKTPVPAEEKTAAPDKTPQPSAKAEATPKSTSTKQKPAKSTDVNKDKASKDLSVAKSSTVAKHSGKIIGLVAAVAVLMGALALVAGYYNYTQWQTAAGQNQSLKGEQASLVGSLSELRSQIVELNKQNTQLNSQLQQAQDNIQQNHEQQAVLKVAIEKVSELAAQKGNIPLYWKYAEVEYLLTLANHRLILSRDTETALFALQDADARLKAIADPAMIPIRGKIADEIAAIKALELPDIPGMAARLSGLVTNIEQLPLISKEHLMTLQVDDKAKREIGSLSELPGVIWDDIKSLVRIRHSDTRIEPLLPPDEKHYLSQNLGLKLEQSRIALLNRDTAVFRQNLQDTRQWVERYFDPSSASVTNVIATVNDLESIQLNPVLPDISGSLRQLRDWISQYKNQANAKLETPEKSARIKQMAFVKSKLVKPELVKPKLESPELGKQEYLETATQ